MPFTIQASYKSIFADGARVYRLMPRDFRLRYWFVLFLQVVFALTEVATVLVLAFFAMSMGDADSVKRTAALRHVFQLFPGVGDFCADNRYFLVASSLFVLVFIVLRNAAMAFVMLRTSYFAERLSTHIGRETISRYMNRDYAWHLSPESAAVYERMLARNTLATFLTAQVHFYSNIISSVLVFSSLFVMEPMLTLLVLAVYAVICLATYRFSRARVDAAGKTVAGCARDENLIMGALTRGIREVLTYRLQKVFVETAGRSMENAIPPRAFLGIAGAIPTWLLESAGFATISLALYVRIRLWDADLPSIIWACSMLFLTAWRVLPSVGRAMRYLVLMRESRAAAFPMLELLETFIDRRVEPEPDPAPDFRFEESLCLEDLRFRYPGASEDSLDGLNLCIRRGECLGVLGRSGAGKSTLAGVLSGLLAPTGGRMLVDGRELTPARLAAYRRGLGYVPQTPFLLNGTVAENVAMNQWGRPIDRERVRRACEAAAMDFVTERPDGLDQRVTEVNAGLSGGQVQRLSIARAIYAEPALIVFDEATSSLDKANEAAIQTTLDALRGKVTCIIIAHRLSALTACDRVLWLERGRARRVGAPDEIVPEYENWASSCAAEEAERESGVE